MYLFKSIIVRLSQRFDRKYNLFVDESKIYKLDAVTVCVVDLSVSADIEQFIVVGF